MNILIQARMSSSRLPGKVLMEIRGRPILQYLIDRFKSITDKKIVVLTSTRKDDNPIVDYCEKNDFLFYRGSLKDVAARFLYAAEKYDFDSFIRINADSPLIDPIIVNRANDIFNGNKLDLVTNTFPRTFPIGQSVEVISTSALKNAYSKMSSPAHFEHVTTYFYENFKNFRIKNFQNNFNLSSYRLSVDTHSDFKKIKSLICNMEKSHTLYSLKDLMKELKVNGQY